MVSGRNRRYLDPALRVVYNQWRDFALKRLAVRFLSGMPTSCGLSYRRRACLARRTQIVHILISSFLARLGADMPVALGFQEAAR